MLVDGYEKGLAHELREDVDSFKNIVICGMGGSGIVGDFFLAVFNKQIPIKTVKSFFAPLSITEKTLVVAVSYSGETLETLECAQKSIEVGAKVYAITNEKSSLAKIVGLERVISVTPGLLPRAALPEMLGSLLGFLIGEEYRSEISKTSSILSDTKEFIKKGEHIAEFLIKGLPVISSCGKLSSIAIRWGQELAENSKTPSIIEIYPEAAHNSIVGWENPPPLPYRFLILKYNKEGICYLIEEMIHDIYNKVPSGGVYQLDLRRFSNVNELSILLVSSIIAGYTSINLAKMKGIDPTKTKNIEFYKLHVVNKMKENFLGRLGLG